MLQVLRAFAAMWKQVRQQRVTDKGKEKHGTQPSRCYMPTPITADEAQPRVGLDQPTAAPGRTADPGVAAGTAEVLHRAGQLVAIKSSSGLWLAQLTEPLVGLTAAAGQSMRRGRPSVRYNVERLSVRYFVKTVEF